MSTQEKWVNQDGLVVRFGPKFPAEENAVPAQAVTAGTLQEVVFNIPDATRLATTATFANGGLDERGVKLPNGAVIESAIFYGEVSFTTGSSATLNVGTYRVDGTVTNGGDADGLFAAAALNTLEAGDRTVGAGAQIGATLAITAPTGRDDDGVFVAATTSTGTFTAGKGRIVITYRVPTSI
jgi:hypothetical protein